MSQPFPYRLILLRKIGILAHFYRNSRKSRKDVEGKPMANIPDRSPQKGQPVFSSNVHPRSHLFTVRVWEEEIRPGQTEWRGKVQLLTNGEVRYFREWAALGPLL